jgi:hypothetical protein
LGAAVLIAGLLAAGAAPARAEESSSSLFITDPAPLAEATANLQAVLSRLEFTLGRWPRVYGRAAVVGKSGWRGSDVLPALDRDGRPIPNASGPLAQPAGYHDLDLGILAPLGRSDGQLGLVLNAGNYASSYRDSGHAYGRTGPAEAHVHKLFIHLPSAGLTLGRLGVGLTPYTFRAVDPDVTTRVPREDSGEVSLWGLGYASRRGDLQARAFFGGAPRDGRLLPLNDQRAPPQGAAQRRLLRQGNRAALAPKTAADLECLPGIERNEGRRRSRHLCND